MHSTETTDNEFHNYTGNFPFGLVMLDGDLNLMQWNDFARDHLFIRKNPDSMREKAITEEVNVLAPYAEELKLYRKGPGDTQFRISLTVEGSFLDLTFFRFSGGYLLLIQDQTKERMMEFNSIQSILTGQENERKRLARDIHDGIAPLLSTAKLELDIFLEELKAGKEDLSVFRLKNIRETIDSISTDLRDLSHRLLPRVLEEFGLYIAFKNNLNRINTSGRVFIDYFSNLGPKERFDQDIELNLYRCGQELISNAIKHARATKIILQLIKHEKSIVLMVEDDGMGFKTEESSMEREGIGLTNIETRVRSLNGEFIIESEPEQGTLVSIEIPLSSGLKI